MPYPGHRRITQTIIGVLLTGLTTNCTTTTPASNTPSSSTTTTATATTADETCARFATAALAADATTDRGPSDARRRAAHQYGTPDLTATITGEGRDPDWQLLASRQARVVVTTEPATDDHPQHHPDQAAVAVIARRTAVAADGSRHRLADAVVYCTLTNGTNGWRITAVTFADSTSAVVP